MLDRTLSIAPMMGCTDRYCRFLMRQVSPDALLYTEMVTTGALIHGHCDYLLAHDADEPVALQLGGSDPVALATCSKMGEDRGYQEINLNVGCPSDRVKAGGIGACLMKEPALVAECLAAMRAAVSIPVTVKSRIGVDDQDSLEAFCQFVETLRAAGTDTFIIHARKAILNGLSPRENREIPPLNYDFVRHVRDLHPDLSFSLNGGISSVADAVTLAREFDGVMLGRAPYHDTWLLDGLQASLFEPTGLTRADVLERYLTFMEREAAAGTHVKHMAKHLFGLFLGCHGARRFRRLLTERMHKPGAGVDIVMASALEAGVLAGDASPAAPLRSASRG